MDGDEVIKRRVPRLRLPVWVGLILMSLAVGLWPLFRPANPDAALRWQDGRLIGEIAGYVASVDREERRLDVSSNRFALHSIDLLLTEDTTITVHGKQGGVGDLWNGLPVRVGYELRGDQRLATAIEVVSSERRALPGSVSTPPASLTPFSVQPVPDPVETMPPAGLAPTTAPSGEEPLPPVRVTPPAAVAPPEQAPAPPSRRTSRAAAQQRRASQQTDQADRDGSDAIDWLFKQGSRR